VMSLERTRGGAARATEIACTTVILAFVYAGCLTEALKSMDPGRASRPSPRCERAAA
jgi:hypothetical protein